MSANPTGGTQTASLYRDGNRYSWDVVVKIAERRFPRMNDRRKEKHNVYAKGREIVATELTRIDSKACQCPELVFTSLYHHITDIDNLRAAYNSLDGRKAVGVDGQSKADYGENLEANLGDLSERLARMGYRPQAKRRTYVPKPGSDKDRPLGISTVEDKIVEQATKRVLEPLWEPLFRDCSYGYRPDRNVHQCIDRLARTIQQRRVNHVVEADIRGFFDHVNHEWLMEFVQQRIGDPRVLRLLQCMLKSGIMEDGLLQATEEGTPQGSILSPLLANIYLHYVLDLWFDKKVEPSCEGEAYLFRYADDFVVCFQYRQEAEQFQATLKERLEHFDLEMAEEKTRTLAFGRYARRNAQQRGQKPGQFEFLGFIFYCGKTRRGNFKVKRRTSKKKMDNALARFTEWIIAVRHKYRTAVLLARARSRIQGHLNSYAITDNRARCQMFLRLTKRILKKWLNRRSQRKSYNWDKLNEVLRAFHWPEYRVYHDLSPMNKLSNVHVRSRMWESRSSGSVRDTGTN